MGRLKQRKKKRIHIVGDCTTGWRVGGALWKLSLGVEGIVCLLGSADDESAEAGRPRVIRLCPAPHSTRLSPHVQPTPVSLQGQEPQRGRQSKH